MPSTDSNENIIISSYHKHNTSPSMHQPPSIPTSSQNTTREKTDTLNTITSHPTQTTSSQKNNTKKHCNNSMSILSKLRSRKKALSSRGYKKTKIISPTLQGQVFIAEKTHSHPDSLLVDGYIAEMISDTINPIIINNICFNYLTSPDVVIKTANKTFHQMNEDIVQESKLMAMFMQNNPPLSLIKYYDFFEDENNYYLVMERGGQGLFEFVVECHRYINEGILALKEWKKVVRFIFVKMLKVLDWMHNVVHCCNLDVSLENIVMTKDTSFDRKTGQINNLDIRFIDFGLTERFNVENAGFVCNKFVGKLGYKSPEIFKLETFCANKADIYSLGVCLFMMSIGAPPYNKPCKTDAAFQVLMDKKMVLLLKSWNRLKYIGKSQYDLVMKMLCFDENKRISVEDIMKHRWVRSYFMKKKKIDKNIDHQMQNMVQTPSIVESETFEIVNDDNCANMHDDQ